MIPNVDYWEMAILLIVAVMMFGSNLPEVGRKLGKSLGELRKTFRGFEEQFRSVTNLDLEVPETPAVPARLPPQLPTAPKFEPPPADDPQPQAGLPVSHPQAGSAGASQISAQA